MLLRGRFDLGRTDGIRGKKMLWIMDVLFLSFFNLTYSRWTSSLPSCLWSLRIFPSLPGSRLTIFYRDASSALLQLDNQWLNFEKRKVEKDCIFVLVWGQMGRNKSSRPTNSSPTQGSPLRYVDEAVET